MHSNLDRKEKKKALLSINYYFSIYYRSCMRQCSVREPIAIIEYTPAPCDPSPRTVVKFWLKTSYRLPCSEFVRTSSN